MNIKKIQDLRKQVERQEYLFGCSIKFITEIIDKFREYTGDITVPAERLTINGIEVASGYTRIVIGGHGPYIEFSGKEFLMQPDLMKANSIPTRKYDHMYFRKLPGVKVYSQVNRVRYADYRPGFFYIDLIEFDFIKGESNV